MAWRVPYLGIHNIDIGTFWERLLIKFFPGEKKSLKATTTTRNMLSSSSAPSRAPAHSPPRTLVLFGDSITQMSFGEGGFGAVLADAYARRMDVRNRGFSGYNTRWARHYFGSVFGPGPASGGEADSGEAPPEHELVVVFFGANDASLEEHNARQHVPLHEA